MNEDLEFPGEQFDTAEILMGKNTYENGRRSREKSLVKLETNLGNLTDPGSPSETMKGYLLA